MSLVAYDSSCSDSEDEDETITAITLKKTSPEKDFKESTFNLPVPQLNTVIITEVDDEFLHKKPISIEKPPPLPKKSGVKIILPALSAFDDDEIKKKPITAPMPKNVGCGLLNLLPKPQKSMSFTSNTKLVPDSVGKPTKPMVPRQVTKTTTTVSTSKTLPAVVKPIENNANSSDEDDNDEVDFFALDAKEVLPDVSAVEINEMIAKKTAELKRKRQPEVSAEETPQSDYVEASTSSYNQVTENDKMNAEAIQALCGSSAKRNKRENVNIIELSGDHVLPNKDEWLRNHLQAATEYQPRGLVDEEVAAGTRRKHQITYLAHQAKANELELQSMWAANRHTRRQTQNKYGF